LGSGIYRRREKLGGKVLGRRRKRTFKPRGRTANFGSSTIQEGEHNMQGGGAAEKQAPLKFHLGLETRA